MRLPSWFRRTPRPVEQSTGKAPPPTRERVPVPTMLSFGLLALIAWLLLTLNSQAALSGRRAPARDTRQAGQSAGLGTLAVGQVSVAERFRRYYDQNGGLRIFGEPISPLLFENGREFQWFERARLEYWPEHTGTLYEIQPGRIGTEYAGSFAPQAPSENTPDSLFFSETGQPLRGGFLVFWRNNGDLRIFGYPISAEIQQTIAGQPMIVQYFERGRLEYHQDLAGTPDVIQVGLLGRELLEGRRMRQ